MPSPREKRQPPCPCLRPAPRPPQPPAADGSCRLHCHISARCRRGMSRHVRGKRRSQSSAEFTHENRSDHDNHLRDVTRHKQSDHINAFRPVILPASTRATTTTSQSPRTALPILQVMVARSVKLRPLLQILLLARDRTSSDSLRSNAQ